MPYKVSYDEQNKIVVARVFGVATPEDHGSAQEESFRLCREKNSLRVLVDLKDLDTRLSTTLSSFGSGERTAEADIPALTRIAYITPKDPKSAEDLKFATTVAANRGRIIRLFDSAEQAQQWLLEAAVHA